MIVDSGIADRSGAYGSRADGGRSGLDGKMERLIGWVDINGETSGAHGKGFANPWERKRPPKGPRSHLIS